MDAIAGLVRLAQLGTLAGLIQAVDLLDEGGQGALARS